MDETLVSAHTRTRPAIGADDAPAREVPPPQLREFTLVAEQIEHEIMPGVFVQAWAYNGQIPGPELRVNEGDTVRVTLVNRLPAATTVHWHGIDNISAMDGPAGLNQAAVEPGQDFVYEWIADPAGSRMYHSHTDVHNQVQLGLYGPLIVEPRQVAEDRAYDREYTYLLSEWDLELTPDVATGAAPKGPRDSQLRGGELGADLTFTTPGEYDYACWIHRPYMVGKIVVQEAGSPLPMEQDGVDALAQEELAAFIETAKSLLASLPSQLAGGAPEVLIAPGNEHVELLTYLPQEVTIKAGETVRWTYAGSMSPHTVTFLGGGEPIEDIIPVGDEAGPPAFAINPNSFFASDSAAQPYGGEGIVNSGYLGLPGMSQGFELVFAAPGEYGYYCILHAGGPEEDPTMSTVGTVIVTE